MCEDVCFCGEVSMCVPVRMCAYGESAWVGYMYLWECVHVWGVYLCICAVFACGV